MMANRQNSASGNREEDRNPSFVLFGILNGVLATLVLACISLGIVVAVKSPNNDIFIFYRIGFIVDLSAVIIGFIAVAKRNESSIVAFLLVSAIVYITDIMQSWIYCITRWTSNVSVNPSSNINDKKIKAVLNVLNIFRSIAFLGMLFLSVNLVEMIQNTNRGLIGRVRFMTNTTTNGPQNQEGTVELGNKELFGHRTIIH